MTEFELKLYFFILIYFPGWDVGPSNHSKAHVLINHAKYNRTVFSKYIRPDFQYIVPIREPTSLFISAVKYFATYKVVKNGTVSTCMYTIGAAYFI